MEIPGNNLIPSDHLCESTHVGLCIYYKNFLYLIVLDIQYLYEFIDIELKIGRNLCYVIALKRSSRQSKSKIETFYEKLQLNLDSLAKKIIFLMVSIRDFNVK